ncbi:DUF4097 domain-containing protein [Embleya sp. NPDC059259]|uniref:DUF4097 family beta strand repeat-containing protein n=1 Tax=unclassified Embleya TaxID=2699296 RepID=UPI0036A31FCE
MPNFATSGPITATLITAGARVRVVASDRPDTVVLVEPINRTDKSDVKVADNTKVDFAGGELSIQTNVQGGKNGSVAISIELPTGSRLVLKTAWTDVHADGLLGDCELHISSGQIQLDHIAALRANLMAGDVAIKHIAGTVDIESASAGLRLGEVAGAVKYQGASGNVWIGTALSDVELGSSSGSFDIDRAEGSVNAQAANCPIRIGRITRGHAKLLNASGGIEIGISQGTAAWVDAKSTKGAVRNSLSTQDKPDEFDNKINVYARTRLDDIVLHRAAG